MKVINIKGRIIGDGSKWIYDWLDIPATCPRDVLSVLQNAKDEDVEIYINSGGGSVFDGYEIYNAIAEYKGNITIKIVGLAASAASFLAQAPNAKCYMSPLAEMMIHNASSYAEGPHQSMDATSQMLQVTDSTIAKAYTIKSGKSEEEIRALMEAETWLTSEQAKDLGLIDGILFEAKTEPKKTHKLYNALNLDDDVILSDLEKCRTVDELKNRLTENLDKMFKNVSKPQSTIVNSVINKNFKEESTLEIKNVEELRNVYPDLVQQVENSAAESARNEERNRFKAIDDISNNLDPELVNKAKYIEPMNAEKLAFEALKNDTVKGANVLNTRIEELNNSGADEIGTVENDIKNNKNETKQTAVNLLVNAAKGLIGGRE
ncbi:MAG: head maturation protease, ClpP-related [Clostridiaceae bacterium]